MSEQKKKKKDKNKNKKIFILIIETNILPKTVVSFKQEHIVSHSTIKKKKTSNAGIKMQINYLHKSMN